VVGFTLEAGKPEQALGALLLFLTNVAAILASGTVVMALYGVHRLVSPAADPERRTVNRRGAVIIIAAMVIAVSVPLTTTSATLARDSSREAKTLAAAREFGHSVGWKTGNVTTQGSVVTVHMEGPPRCPGRSGCERSLRSGASIPPTCASNSSPLGSSPSINPASRLPQGPGAPEWNQLGE
jgi:hypothetical protein